MTHKEYTDAIRAAIALMEKTGEPMMALPTNTDDVQKAISDMPPIRSGNPSNGELYLWNKDTNEWEEQ